ncbi:MAG: O-antigen ligase family protein [Anaerolineales bacterium]|jgi:O-antigen ligase|nr:O-antigen ligase family protein [Anaerolineales bacterium]MDP7644456.1 O-antigen ligase family protein [Anaerolineales bacterium]
MRRILTILCALATLATLLGATALLAQHRQRSRGQPSGLPPASLTPRPANLYGVNIALLSTAPPSRDTALENAAAGGFGWVRQTFPWREHDFDWDATDALVKAVSAQELKLIAVLSAERAPENPVAFAAFAARFARRYAENIDVYQIWDEPNLKDGWGGLPSAAAYGRLLAASHAAIHRADARATVLLAGLAPTIETGPENISDLLFLRQLYAAGAAPFFDAAAGKPYGFNAGPHERNPHPKTLNFSRFILLRAEMERAGDEDKLLWGSHFGWYNAGAAANATSTWGGVNASRQAEYTAAAFERAQSEWPWAGVLVLENLQPSEDPSDPRWGFSLLTPDGRPRAILENLRQRLAAPETAIAPPGVHSADAPFARYEGAWQFSKLGADIPQSGAAEISFAFEGTDLGLVARRGDYRATLFVQVDDEPASQLPRSAQGEAYQILTSPDLSSRVELLPLAAGLRPGRHTATIRAERGWEQWAIVGFSVGNTPPREELERNLTALAALGMLALVGLIASVRERTEPLHAFFLALGERANVLLALGLAALFWFSAGMAWGQALPQLFRRQSDALPLALTTLSVGLFYFSPWLLLTLGSLLALLVLFYARPAIALALIALATPFYLQPRPMFERVFSAVEIFTLLAAVAVSLRWLSSRHAHSARAAPRLPTLNSLDLAVLAFALLAALSLFSAELRGVALNELRVMVLEPVLFYALLRSIPLQKKELWRVVDFFVLGAALVAAIGLIQYALGVNLITAEGGVLRLRSVYGSPNNVGLYLGRALPVATAVMVLGGARNRRLSYLGAVLLMAAALALSFSRGALLLGVPAALAVIILFRGGKRAAGALFALLGVATAALFAFARHPRIVSLLSRTAGPTFFRLNLWRSALNMISDHPLTGVGLDNFLYAYRGRYIAPAAWQDPHLSHAHNWLLDFATRLGLPGLAVAFWLLVAFFRTAVRAVRTMTDPGLRALAVGLVASMADFLAHGMVDASYWFVDLAFAFMLMVALAQRLTNQRDPALT